MDGLAETCFQVGYLIAAMIAGDRPGIIPVRVLATVLFTVHGQINLIHPFPHHQRDLRIKYT